MSWFFKAAVILALVLVAWSALIEFVVTGVWEDTRSWWYNGGRDRILARLIIPVTFIERIHDEFRFL